VTTPTTTADPLGGVTTTSYEPGGQPAAVTSWAGTTNDSYDVNGDLSGTTYSNTASGYTTPHSVTTTFNQDGSRNQVSDGAGTTTYG
jgi:hypothetical protein